MKNKNKSKAVRSIKIWHLIEKKKETKSRFKDLKTNIIELDLTSPSSNQTWLTNIISGSDTNIELKSLH